MLIVNFFFVSIYKDCFILTYFNFLFFLRNNDSAISEDIFSYSFFYIISSGASTVIFAFVKSKKSLKK